jgi:hypothetical protein
VITAGSATSTPSSAVAKQLGVVALAPDLAVADDVDAGALHVPDGHDGRVVLGLLEQGLGDAPGLKSHAGAPFETR